MRIVAACNVYMDSPLLRESLPTVRARCDVLIVVDGRYAQFPDAWHGFASADGTLDVAREFADLVIEAPGCPWPSEIAKRNAYLERCREGDYVLVVDADEALEGPLPLDRDAIARRDDWLVDLYREENARLRQPIHRLFRWRPGIRYEGTHHAVHVGDRLVRPADLDLAPGLTLRHFQCRRCAERSAPKGAYYRWLDVAEMPFRGGPGSGMDALGAKTLESVREKIISAGRVAS